MAIEDYRIDCKYRIGTIKPRLYLIKKDGCRIKLDAIHKNVSFSLTEGNVYYIDADSADYSQTVTDDNRWAFANQLTFRVNEIKYNTFFEELRDICTNDYFYVITDMENNSWLINAETYSDVTYTYTFTNGEDNDSVSVVVTNHTNYPLLLNLSDLSDATPIIQKECGYNYGKPIELYISSIRDNEWKKVDFLDDSFTFTQTYDGELVDRTLTFSIPLDEKFSFAYNLLEYDDNTYRIKFTTSNDNEILCGNKYRPTHTIDTSEDVGNPNLITFTFNQVGNYCYNSEDTSMWKKYKWSLVKLLEDGQAVYEELVSYDGFNYNSQQEKVFTEREAPVITECKVTDTTFDKETYCITVTTNAYKMELSLLELEGTLNENGVCFDKEYIKTKEDGIYAALNVRLYCTEDDWWDKNYHDQKIYVEIKDGEIVGIYTEDEEGKISRWKRFDINEDYYCEANEYGTYTKWYKEYEEVSYDGGKSWAMSGNYRKGDKVNMDFNSCDEYWDGNIFRWVSLPIGDGWYCVEEDPKANQFTCNNIWNPLEGKPFIGTPPNNEIWYITADEMPQYISDWTISKYNEIYGTNISMISNTYVNGLGIIKFSDDIIIYPREYLFQLNNATKIMLPNSIVEIDYEAFKRLSKLFLVKIPDNVKIEKGAFNDCTNLYAIDLSNSSNLEIGRDMFRGCTNLRIVDLPSNLTTIGYGAFMQCPNLNCIYIPSSVTSIDEEAFYMTETLYGDGLISVTFEEGSQLTTIGNSAFYGCSMLSVFEIPSTVTEIGKSAFYGCSGLTSIEIPDGITTIKERTFCECRRLVSLTIPNSVTKIESQALAWATNLRDMYYDGTLEQFKAISRKDAWSGSGIALKCILHCTDGDYKLNEI